MVLTRSQVFFRSDFIRAWFDQHQCVACNPQPVKVINLVEASYDSDHFQNFDACGVKAHWRRFDFVIAHKETTQKSKKKKVEWML